MYPDDDILLLNQVFSENNKLLSLYKIFLLDLHVEISELKAVIKEDLIYKIIELEIFEKSKDNKVRSKVSITPLEIVILLMKIMLNSNHYMYIKFQDLRTIS